METFLAAETLIIELLLVVSLVRLSSDGCAFPIPWH
jgi:hypothetical protein